MENVMNVLEEVRRAYSDAVENGYEAEIREMSNEEFALDLHMYDDAFEEIDMHEIVAAVISLRAE
jgi:hypothetical protein